MIIYGCVWLVRAKVEVRVISVEKGRSKNFRYAEIYNKYLAAERELGLCSGSAWLQRC